jgi:GTP-binding protein EngB required for normal cell division
MRENLGKGEGTLDKDKSKVLEALKELGTLTEILFPKTPKVRPTKKKQKQTKTKKVKYLKP